MNEETNIDVSYLSCDINGTKCIYKIAPYSTDMIKDTTFNEEQNMDNIVKETKLENEEEPISLVYLNGQVYTFQNGALQLDTNQIIEQADFHEKPLLASKDMENCENEYINNENIVVKDTYEYSEEQYEVAETQEAKKDFVIGNDNINIDDFIEIVTAFKCKICAYITQNKFQLLNHIQKIHLNSTIDIEVNF